MNIINNNIILILDRNRNKNASLDANFLEIFVPIPFTNCIIERKTLIGRVVAIANLHKTRDHQLSCIKECVARSLEALKDTSQISLSTLIACKTLLPKQKVEMAPIDEAVTCQKRLEKVEALKQQKDRELSYFKKEPKVAFTHLEAVDELLGKTSTLSKETWNYIKEFLNLKDRCKLLDQAIDFQETMKGKGLDQLAKEFSCMVEKEDGIYLGKFGSDRPVLESFSKIIERLPNEVKHDFLSSQLNGLKAQKPEEWAESFIEKSVNQFRADFPEIEEEIVALINDALLESKERKIPEHLRVYLQEWMAGQIESWMQQGLIGNAMEFFPSGAIREALLYVGKEANVLKTKAKRDELAKKFKEKLIELTIKTSREITEPIKTEVEPIVTKLFHALPPAIKIAFGLDDLFQTGQVWFQWEKEEGDFYTIKIFSNGSSLDFQQLVIRHVKKEALNEAFFKRLLELDLAPPENVFVRKAFFEGPIELLKKEGASFEFCQDENIKESTGSILEMVLIYFSQKNRARVLFDLKLNALICLAKDKTIQKKAVELSNALLEEAGALDQETFKRMEATHRELLRKVVDAPPQESSTSPTSSRVAEPLKELIQSFSFNSGLTTYQVGSLKEIIAFLLGEECGELIEEISLLFPEKPQGDKINETLKSLKPKVDSSRGRLGTFLYSAYFSTAITIILWAIRLWKLVSGLTTTSLLLFLQPFATDYLKQLIPEEVALWCSKVKRAIYKKLADMVVSLLLHLLFSNETTAILKELQSNTRSIKEFQQQASNIAAYVQGKLLIKETASQTISLPTSKKKSVKIGQSPLKESSFSGEYCYRLVVPMIIETKDEIESIEFIEEKLEEWIGHYKYDRNHKTFLIEQFLLLPGPQENPDLWLRVTDPKRVMKAVFDLDLLNPINDGFSKDDAIILYLHMLSISDFLCRQVSNTKLDHFKINIAYFLRFYGEREVLFLDPAKLDVFQKAICYFCPDVDFDDFYTSDQINEIEFKSLSTNFDRVILYDKVWKKYISQFFDQVPIKDLSNFELFDYIQTRISLHQPYSGVVPEEVAYLFELCGAARSNDLKFYWPQFCLYPSPKPFKRCPKLQKLAYDVCWKLEKSAQILNQPFEKPIDYVRERFYTKEVQQTDILKKCQDLRSSCIEMSHLKACDETARFMQQSVSFKIFTKSLKNQLLSSPQTVDALKEYFLKGLKVNSNKVNLELAIYFYRFVEKYQPGQISKVISFFEELKSTLSFSNQLYLDAMTLPMSTKEGKIALLRSLHQNQAKDQLTRLMHHFNILKVFIQNPENLKEVVKKVFQDYKIVLPDEKIRLISNYGYIYIGTYKLCLFQGLLYCGSQLCQAKSLIAKKFSKFNPIKELGSSWRSAIDPTFAITSTHDGFVAKRKINNMTTQFVDASRVVGIPVNEGCWVAEKEDLLSVFTDEEEYQLKKEGEGRYTLIEEEKLPEIQPVSVEYFKRALFPLKRFLPFEKMRCFARPGSAFLEGISYPNYGLEFKRVGDQLISQTIGAGFALAKNQYHLALTRYSSYLLLERGKEKKVILPKGDYLATFINGWIPSFSLLLPLFREHVSFVGEQKCFLFDLNSEGCLVADDIEAALHLIVLGVLTANQKQVNDNLELVKEWARYRPLSSSSLQTLFMLTLHPKMQNTMGSLIALCEENLIKNKISFQNPAMIPLLYFALFSKSYENSVEWFLFQALKRSLLDSISLFKERAKGWEEEVFINVFLPLNLKGRYQRVLSWAGKEKNMTTEIIDFGKEVFHAPSRFSKLHSIARLPHADIAGVSKNELSRFFYDTFLMAKQSFLTLTREELSDHLVDHPVGLIDRMSLENLKKHFSYYYLIAVGDFREKAQKDLKEKLLLHAGGWDLLSAKLITILKMICSYPNLFPIGLEMFKAKENKWCEFFSKIEWRAFAIEKAKKEAAFGVKLLSPFVFSFVERELYQKASLALPYETVLAKAYHLTMKTRPSIQMEQPATFCKSSSALKLIEEPITHVLDTHFNSLFAEIEIAEKVDQQPLLQIETDEVSIQERVERVNRGLRDFYAMQTPITQYILKNKEQIWALYLDICKWHEGLKEAILQDEKKLSAFGSIEAMTKGFMHNQYQFEKPVLPDTLKNLDKAIAKLLIRNTWRSHFGKILAAIERCAESDFDEDSLFSLRELLQTRRVYSLDKTPTGLLRIFLGFEATFDLFLWKKQAEQISAYVEKGQKDLVIELLMSLGKSFFGMPTIANLLADGKTLVVLVFPEQMIETNMRIIAHQCRRLGQNAYRLSIRRQDHLSLHQFEAIYVMMKRAIENREVLVMTKQDLQSLELLFIDHLLLAKKSTKQLAIAKRIASILLLLRRQGHIVGDEAHELFNEREELNYPLGTPVSIGKEDYDVMEIVLEELFTFPEWIEGIQKGELELTAEDYKKLALKVHQHPLFKKIPTSLWLNFVLGSTECDLKEIQKHPLYAELSLIKGIFTTLLPLSIKRKVSVDYGKSAKVQGAIPYNGNVSPQEQSSIKHPFEAVQKTFILFVQNGLSIQQIKKLVEHLISDAEMEENVQKRPFIETKASKLYQHITGKLLQDKVVLEELAPFERSKEALFYYLKKIVAPNIKYWKKSLSSNAQNFASMFHSMTFDTGTPFNDGTYASKLEMLWDKGTLGHALHLLHHKCKKEGIHYLESTRPKAVLEEVLSYVLKPASKFTSLIDGGAKLRGLSNREVAKKIQEHVLEHHLEIEAIDYFDCDEEGNERLMSLPVQAKVPISFEGCKIPLDKRFAYFDQRHGFAANIPQKPDGVGYVLLGNEHTLFRLLQEVFRMRGIKCFQEIKEGKLIGGQMIEIGVTKKVLEAMKINKLPTLNEILTFVVKNEGMQVARINYDSYKQKVSDLLRKHALYELITAKDPLKTLESFDSLLVSETVIDPRKLFGGIDKKLPASQVVETIQHQAINLSKKLLPKQSTSIEEEILKLSIPPMPKEIEILWTGDAYVISASDDFEKEMSQEIENENENENELQQELEAQTKRDFAAPYVPDYKEKSWGNSIDLNRPKVTLKKIVDLICSIHSNLPKGAFDSRLHFSENFFPPGTQLGSYAQRPLFEVLVEMEEEEIVRVTALSQLDAVCFRKEFKKGSLSKCKTPGHASGVGVLKQGKVFLYDVPSRFIVAGDQVPLENLRKHKTLIALETQLKFLNGDVNYHIDLHPYLKKWIYKVGKNKLKTAFSGIYHQRHTAPYERSDIAYLFD